MRQNGSSLASIPTSTSLFCSRPLCDAVGTWRKAVLRPTHWDDEEHLVYAAERGMALMTSDASDFIPMARRWYANGREHAGIIITPEFSRRQVGTLLRWTLRLLDSVTADELHNVVIYLQQFRRSR